MRLELLLFFILRLCVCLPECSSHGEDFTGRPPPKKKAAFRGKQPFIFSFQIVLFSRVNSFRRTNICTSTAVCAYIRIDRVDITFRDSFYRTLVDASSASNTIVTNYVSHVVKNLNY